MEKHNEVKKSPSYFWKNDGGIIYENFDAKHRDKSRYENESIETLTKTIMEKEIDKRVADFMRNENPSKMEDVVNHPKHYKCSVKMMY